MSGDDLLLAHLALLRGFDAPAGDECRTARERLEEELGAELAEHLTEQLARG
jgi:hypothetical protein